MAIPLLDDLDLCGKDLTADAFLTQRNLPTIWSAPAKPTTTSRLKPISPRSGRSRLFSRIANDRRWRRHAHLDPSKLGTSGPPLNSTLISTSLTSASLGHRTDYPQRRNRQDSREIAYGITSGSPGEPRPALARNQSGSLDHRERERRSRWAFDEDRCRNRTGYGPEKFHADAALTSVSSTEEASKTYPENAPHLQKQRAVFDYLRLSKNSFAIRRAHA